MIYRTLGRTGLKVSLLGMGTGGHDPLGQKSGRTEAEMHRLLHGAFDLGINLFDTSPGYLASELILGRALQELPREEFVVSTKFALVTEDQDGNPTYTGADEIRATVAASLRRLHLDTIDILLIQAPAARYYEHVMSEQIPVLQALQQEGKFRYLGSSEVSRVDGAHEWLRKSLPANLYDVVMVAHNMLNQSAQRHVFPYCIKHNIGVLNIFTVRNLFWDPRRLGDVIADLKAHGVLAQDTVPDDDPLGWLLEDSGIESLVEAAYRYAAYTEGVTTVMCGTIELHELEEDAQIIEKGPLPPDKVARLEQTFGHIAEAIGN